MTCHLLSRRTCRSHGPVDEVFAYVADPQTFAAQVELTGLASFAGPVVAHVVRRGVDANIATLRAILER